MISLDAVRRDESRLHRSPPVSVVSPLISLLSLITRATLSPPTYISPFLSAFLSSLSAPLTPPPPAHIPTQSYHFEASSLVNQFVKKKNNIYHKRINGISYHFEVSPLVCCFVKKSIALV